MTKSPTNYGRQIEVDIEVGASFTFHASARVRRQVPDLDAARTLTEKLRADFRAAVEARLQAEPAHPWPYERVTVHPVGSQSRFTHGDMSHGSMAAALPRDHLGRPFNPQSLPKDPQKYVVAHKVVQDVNNPFSRWIYQMSGGGTSTMPEHAELLPFQAAIARLTECAERDSDLAWIVIPSALALPPV